MREYRKLERKGNHSPYGVQMFFTCVARRKNSRPCARAPVDAGARRPGRLQIAGRGRFDRLRALAREPAYQSASTPSCSASVLASVVALRR